MIFESIVSIFILNYLRKNVEKNQDFAKWQKLLKIGIGIGASLIFLDVIHFLPDTLISILTTLLFAAVAYLAYKVPEFSKGKPLVYAILPYMVISSSGQLIDIVGTDFFEKIENYFEAAKFFALIWAVSIWWSGRKQKKALEIERLKALEKEREYEITQKLKAELEVQVNVRTAELTHQKEELETALNELKSTQSQLIQAEKMASLGELTAGIAHEIQNPLNFVNNFSEVSEELLQELQEELDKGDLEEAKVISQDVIENLKKIHHHGKRADSIVKGMLAHSRLSSGEKVPTDINELADEFLRLSYHGLRAKDKSFNADYKTDFAPDLPQVNVVSQDIGRVLLNLINNAFQACAERKGQLPQSPNPDGYREESFQPLVHVSTKNLGNKIEISVKDNGSGIPDSIKDKIFQPFFTTKPTGQGTGLGLSLSYDIVKAHGGEIRVKSREGEGTEFTIQLPLV
ncbi:ATP-binding protein [Aquiflexum sp. LQ15W]|uniref:sensor histidine kinase n=1 Tax=Cognataquiflexum nitidum TaxID=2922272 RepID=UPI001F13B976|nr:ATP-binding protein [Cognataquiflexum nitidum]MCH6201638.1 ATP-binding protein [Cognataquiflexum nitidum]